jgi:hypothetical protein
VVLIGKFYINRAIINAMDLVSIVNGLVRQAKRDTLSFRIGMNLSVVAASHLAIPSVTHMLPMVYETASWLGAGAMLAMANLDYMARKSSGNLGRALATLTRTDLVRSVKQHPWVHALATVPLVFATHHFLPDKVDYHGIKYTAATLAIGAGGYVLNKAIPTFGEKYRLFNWQKVLVGGALAGSLCNMGPYLPKRYSPGSMDLTALLSSCTKEAKVADSWASSPYAHKLISSESGGWIGVRNKKSSASGLGGLIRSNVKVDYPSGSWGIGNARNECVGFLKYTKRRYGTLEKAWEFHERKGWY